MAVWVYKGEESALIKPKSLQPHIAAGWSVEKGSPKPKAKAKAKPKTVVETKVEGEE